MHSVEKWATDEPTISKQGVYFFTYFTPPFHMDKDAGPELQLHLEEQAKNSKSLEDNINLVRNQKIHYLEPYNGLRHVTNIFLLNT